MLEAPSGVPSPAAGPSLTPPKQKIGLTKSPVAVAKAAWCGRRRMSGALLVSIVAHREDAAMRAFDFARLSRSSIGFDRMLDLLSSSRWDDQPDFPPYSRLGH